MSSIKFENLKLNNTRIHKMMNASSKEEATHMGILDRIRSRITGNDKKEKLENLWNKLHGNTDEIINTAINKVVTFRKMAQLVNNNLPVNERHKFTAKIEPEGSFKVRCINFKIDGETCARSIISKRSETNDALTSLIGKENDGVVEYPKQGIRDSYTVETHRSINGRNVLTEISDDKINKSVQDEFKYCISQAKTDKLHSKSHLEAAASTITLDTYNTCIFALKKCQEDLNHPRSIVDKVNNRIISEVKAYHSELSEIKPKIIFHIDSVEKEINKLLTVRQESLLKNSDFTKKARTNGEEEFIQDIKTKGKTEFIQSIKNTNEIIKQIISNPETKAEMNAMGEDLYIRKKIHQMDDKSLKNQMDAAGDEFFNTEVNRLGSEAFEKIKQSAGDTAINAKISANLLDPDKKTDLFTQVVSPESNVFHYFDEIKLLPLILASDTETFTNSIGNSRRTQQLLADMMGAYMSNHETKISN